LATLKIATLLPMPSARVTTITAVNSGSSNEGANGVLEDAKDVADQGRPTL
jgi:hypothetical protein